MNQFWSAGWADKLSQFPSPLALEWALLLAVAALAGHLVQRHTQLPKIIGYAVVGAVAGWLSLADAAWPLHGIGIFLLELGIAVVLFEAGARLSVKWFRHNPMVLVQSLAESTLTFATAYLALRALGLDIPVVRALSVIAVASSPAVLMRVALDLRSNGPVTDRAVALATLNTLYALTIGTAMLRTIDRGDGSTLLASMAGSISILGVSLVCGLVLAALLYAALKVLNPTSQDTAIVVLALLAVCTGVTGPLGGSAPLAALLGGLVLKHLHPRPWTWPRQLGTAASMLNILMFVLVSATAAQADWGGAAAVAVVALIAVRLVTKVISLSVTSFGSGMALRKTLWVGIAMVPMSSVALLLTSEFVAASRTIGSQVAAVALPVILVTELLGAVLVTWALYRTGEASPPQRRRPTPAATAEDTQP